MAGLNIIWKRRSLFLKGFNNGFETILINKTLRNHGNFRCITSTTKGNIQIPPTNNFHTINNPAFDTTHFFSSPNKTANEPIKTPLTDSDSTSMDIGSAIRQYQNRKRRVAIYFISATLLSLLIGYKVIYKVIYREKESYIPFWPCNKYHKLTAKEQEKLNVNNVKSVVNTKLMGKLTRHDFIKEQYGVPLRISTKTDSEEEKFDVWCEDQDLVVFGILLEPNDSVKVDSQNKRWHMVPGLFKWKFSHQSINIKERIQDILDVIGIKYDKMITPEVIYDTFKYEVPIHAGNENNHAMHICFYGELNLDKDSKVTYKGKYHVDAKFEEIELLRTEDGKLVKYILYKD